MLMVVRSALGRDDFVGKVLSTGEMLELKWGLVIPTSSTFITLYAFLKPSPQL